MMRFILDCLRPGRARAAASARDSVELHAQKEEALDDNEMKELKNEVDMEKETLQRVKDLCCDTQVTVDSLDQRKTELKEQLKVIQDFQKQESETLVSLKDEESELKQIILQFETELSRASRELLHLQEEVTCAKEHVRQMHGQFDPLQESARESLAEIEQDGEFFLSQLIQLMTQGEHYSSPRGGGERACAPRGGWESGHYQKEKDKEVAKLYHCSHSCSQFAQPRLPQLSQSVQPRLHLSFLSAQPDLHNHLPSHYKSTPSALSQRLVST